MSIRQISIVAGLSLMLSMSFSAVEVGLRMGGMFPDNDALVQQSFGSNFSWQGVLGFVGNNGWELRGTLAQYGDISHHPSDNATGFRVDMTGLFASLIYHIQPSTSQIQPYIGGGVGAYFFNFRDDIIGQLESDTKFGLHYLAGIKVALNDDVAVVSEYSRHNISRTFYNYSNNFDLSSFTIGVDIQLPEYTQQSSTPKYAYSRYEEELLLEIQQTRKELDEMRKRRSDAQQQIDDFYLTADPKDPKFDEQYAPIKFLESKLAVMDRQIEKARDSLLELSKTWEKDHIVSQPVETHVVYLENNYRRSPYGLQMSNGYIVRPGFVHQPQFSYGWSPSVVIQAPAPTVEDKKSFVDKKAERLKQMKNRPLL
jgi:outer membrane protein W